MTGVLLNRTCDQCERKVNCFVSEMKWKTGSAGYECLVCKCGAKWVDFSEKQSVDDVSKRFNLSRSKASSLLRLVHLQNRSDLSTASVHCKNLVEKANSGVLRRQYTTQHLDFAVEYAKENDTGCRTAARASELHFGLPENAIPHTTVYRRLKNPTKREFQIGAARKLTSVEESIVVQQLLMRNVPMTFTEANDQIVKIVTRRGRENPFKKSKRPSTGFWKGLLQRNPLLLKLVGR